MRIANGGRIILMDFGAGEFMNQPSADRRMRGTPLYLAPEVFGGGGASVATDIYAAGVLLYYLVTGGYPVNGSSIDGLADAHRKGARRRLRDARPDLPDAFVAIVERALDVDPVRRFESAGEMYAALGGREREGTGPTHAGLTLRQKVVRVGLFVVLALAITEVLGLLASRAFEAALRIEPAFSAGPAEYFAVGRRALVPFLLVWTVSAAVVAVLAGLRPLVWPHLGPLRRQLSALNGRIEPATQAALVVCAGVVGFLWLTWQFRDVYWAITALMLDARPGDLDLSILGWGGRELHRVHSQVSVAISFLLGLAAWRWFPRLERRAADPARVRHLRWAALVVALLIVGEETLTRPFLWDRREVVSFGNQRASVIGASSGELLLFMPEKGARSFFRVPVDSPELRRNMDVRPIFLEPESR
jgi:hypothetical protein